MFTLTIHAALAAFTAFLASATSTVRAQDVPILDSIPSTPIGSVFNADLDFTFPLSPIEPHVQFGALADAPTDVGHIHSSARADAHAPIGVMADHTHHAGEFMISYRTMHMRMHGNRDGDSRISSDDVLDDFMVTPTSMSMDMHMLGAMYAPTDWMTVMVMVPYVRKDMDHLTRMGGRFTTKSEGLGDIRLTGMFPIYHEGPHTFHANFGLSIPTGSIDEKDATPADPTASRRLPYPMQLGSGTFDLLPGAVYTYQAPGWSFGAAANGTIRLGENDHAYTLGDALEFTTWWAYEWEDWISTSVRLDYQLWGNIDGADPDLNPMMVPTADPNRRGGQRLDLLFGVNLYAPKGALAGNRLAVEVGLPIYQDLDGPQLETDLLLTIGWQYTF
ncbi:MAG: transporter [Phycisphaerales bacterium]|nr:transporter [Phycisphaerales bacterium]